MKRNPGLERVGDLIDTVLSQVAHVEVGPVMRLRRDWPQIAGRWAESSAPIRLRDDQLTVEVTSGAVASKLRYAVPEIIANANAALGDAVQIRSVSVRVARKKRTSD